MIAICSAVWWPACGALGPVMDELFIRRGRRHFLDNEWHRSVDVNLTDTFNTRAVFGAQSMEAACGCRNFEDNFPRVWATGQRSAEHDRQEMP